MSQLPPQAIAEFQVLWKKHCDEELSLEEAATKAQDVFCVLRLALTKSLNDKATVTASTFL